jgi:hypothetical protein
MATSVLHDGLNPVQEQTGRATVNLLTGLGIDEFLTRTDTNGTMSLQADARSSTVALADNAGAVQTSGPIERDEWEWKDRGRDGQPYSPWQDLRAKGGLDQIDKLVILQGLIDCPQLVIPQLVTVGKQHLEDAALRIRATDHGASREIGAGAVRGQRE